MLFNSALFIVFFIYVMVLYRTLRSVRGQNLMLLAAGYVFYGAWDWRFLSLLFLSTLVDFLVAQRIYRAEAPTARRLCLALSLGFSLSLLGVFKYCNFGLESLGRLLGCFGLQAHFPVLQIILPAGVSFYSFQSMGYVIDVYRGECKPAANLLNYALYVAFFPQLLAGPIERAGHLMPQLESPRRVTAGDYQVGGIWILLGYFKKVVIADTLAPMVDHTFAHPNAVSGIVSLVGIAAFALQIYGDFAGYSLIARGLARLMGIELMRNFNAPYLARNPRDFWERWHISLSSWLRRYLYFSLGGNRKGKARTYANLTITMLLGGLWHGARWNFVIWGGYHGTLLAISHALGVKKRSEAGSKAGFAFQAAMMFGLTLGGWLLFRVADLHQCHAILANILGNFRWTEDVAACLVPTMTALLLLLAYHGWQEHKKDELVLLHANRWQRLGACVFMLATVITVGFSSRQFIYFQF
jgi:D-alanyl-lipoteichoic acid acyltransferase DltB (MBOAT superfamily)